jgi:pilus assembly protein Flp/PilA
MKDRLLSLYTRFKCREEGQAVVEYAVLVSLIVVAALVAITATGTSVSALFSSIATKITAAA